MSKHTLNFSKLRSDESVPLIVRFQPKFLTSTSCHTWHKTWALTFQVIITSLFSTSLASQGAQTTSKKVCLHNTRKIPSPTRCKYLALSGRNPPLFSSRPRFSNVHNFRSFSSDNSSPEKGGWGYIPHLINFWTRELFICPFCLTWLQNFIFAETVSGWGSLIALETGSRVVLAGWNDDHPETAPGNSSELEGGGGGQQATM